MDASLSDFGPLREALADLEREARALHGLIQAWIQGDCQAQAELEHWLTMHEQPSIQKRTKTNNSPKVQLL